MVGAQTATQNGTRVRLEKDGRAQAGNPERHKECGSTRPSFPRERGIQNVTIAVARQKPSFPCERGIQNVTIAVARQKPSFPCELESSTSQEWRLHNYRHSRDSGNPECQQADTLVQIGGNADAKRTVALPGECRQQSVCPMAACSWIPAFAGMTVRGEQDTVI